MKKIIYLLVIIFLSSCGQKGSLYLPQENQVKEEIKNQEIKNLENQENNNE